ncbi:hypothetical protein [Hyphomonas oceanitis]|uniref:Uncharacterized protein n=1 Tax=Hyphomonas oceanitis SCH89 TaxID=1280953 RepID=A0A059GCB8_9PROT|nr:hypothetical protein [Hyphomonas oceanitis]KDA04426.1 hypothetical protein HOC_01045 [Hyphomonas oceanitis SCH89]
MTQNASGLFPFTLASAARGGMALFIQVMIGMVLLAAAGMFAVMTAFAGLILAGAALVMRFAGARSTPTMRPRTEGEPLTLEARRTPRGWTVE